MMTLEEHHERLARAARNALERLRRAGHAQEGLLDELRTLLATPHADEESADAMLRDACQTLAEEEGVMRTIVVLERWSAFGRLVDGLPMQRYVAGVFSSFVAVETWLAARPANDRRRWPGEFRCYMARELAADDPDREELAGRTYGQNGTLWGDTPAWNDPWRGRPPVECHFKLLDIVGLIWGDEFRWAIVAMLPATPAYVAAMTHEVSADCDSYTVYFADGGHTHPAECDLLRAPRPVPRTTRKGLLAAWRWTQQPLPPRPFADFLAEGEKKSGRIA